MSTKSRIRDEERRTRIHLSLYDRIKFLLLFTLVFFVLVWASMADNPLLSFGDGCSQIFNQRKWLVLLFLIEVVRQLHFALSEILAPYHGIWQKYFGAVDKLIHKLSDWNRYRLSRLIKSILLIILLAVVLGAIYHETPVRALFYAPKALWSADRKSTRLNSSHIPLSRMPSSA